MGASSTWVRWSLNSLATIVPFLRIFALKPVSRTVERGLFLLPQAFACIGGEAQPPWNLGVSLMRHVQ